MSIWSANTNDGRLMVVVSILLSKPFIRCVYNDFISSVGYVWFQNTEYERSWYNTWCVSLNYLHMVRAAIDRARFCTNSISRGLFFDKTPMVYTPLVVYSSFSGCEEVSVVGFGDDVTYVGLCPLCCSPQLFFHSGMFSIDYIGSFTVFGIVCGSAGSLVAIICRNGCNLISAGINVALSELYCGKCRICCSWLVK